VRSLLVNFWYAHPVGHAIEGLRYCLGYHRADPSLEISLLLNGASPTELADLCPFIERVYAIDFTGFHDAASDPDEALRAVPKEWDYVVDDHRGRQPQQLSSFTGLRRFYEASDRHFVARTARGTAGSEPPAYQPNQQLRLELPADTRGAARRGLKRRPRWIAFMPAASTDRRYAYPSTSSWQLILRELESAFPEIGFCFIGKLTQDERTATAFGRDELERLQSSVTASVDCFDRPIVEQLALVEACDIFLSPHTGFGMAALAVGTPWLTLSGGRWPEFFFNGVPFYSVLPDPRRNAWYSYFDPPPRLDQDEDGEGPRTPSMAFARIREDLPELIEGARLLLDRRLGYEEALELHFSRLVERSEQPARIWSFDNVHARYV
jgi:ADP-heptose:LPS heptosyltransferase